MPEYLTLDQVAELIGVEITTVRRAAQKIQSSTELRILKGMVPGRSRNALCISDKHAEILVEYFRNKQAQIALVSNSPQNVNLSIGGYGFFYLIQLVPEALPNRVKIGYTDNLDNRLKEHQTAAPTAKLLRSWRCKRAWDQAAMDSITKADCHLIMNEVYEGDIAKFIERGDQFFSVMPSEKYKIPVSPNSPLRNSREDT